MRKIFLIPLLYFILCISYSLTGQINPEKSLTNEEITSFQEMLSKVKNNLDVLASEEVDPGELKTRYAEAENLFFALRHSQEIKDPDLLKRYFIRVINDLLLESDERVDSVRRMEFIYWTMLSIGLSIILMLLVYSIYMYAKRK